MFPTATILSVIPALSVTGSIPVPNGGGALATPIQSTPNLAADGLATYGPLVILLVMAILFAVGNLVLTHLIGPSKTTREKGTVYESGVNPLTSTKRRFNVRFYMVAMTFLIFDVEIVFLYPWAVTFPSLGGEVGELLDGQFLGRMLFFIFTSIIAFVYAWRKGVFRYD